MTTRRRRKCRHCGQLFRPDPRNLRHRGVEPGRARPGVVDGVYLDLSRPIGAIDDSNEGLLNLVGSGRHVRDWYACLWAGAA